MIGHTPTYTDLNRRSQSVGVLTRHAVNLLVAATFCIDPDVPLAGWVVTGVLVGWAIVRLCTRATGVRWAVADVVLTAVYLLATPWLVADLSFVSGASPMLAVAGTAVISFGLAYRPLVSSAVTVIVVSAFAIGAARVPGLGNPASIFSLDFLVVEWALVATVRRLIVRAASLTDRMLTSAAEADVTREVAASRRRHERMHCAVMHDTAASTLLMVGQGAVRDRRLLWQQVRRDLDAIEGFLRPAPVASDPVDLVAALHGLSARTQTPTELRGSAALLVDVGVARAVIAAAGQALTNIDRHAQARRATVTFAAGSVTISDNGIGFDIAGDKVRDRHGVRNSIVRRLEDVGGRAVVESVPGSGTIVLLSWERPPDDILASGAADAERLLAGFGYGLVAIAVVTILLQSPRALAVDTGHPVGQAVVVVLALTCAAVAAVGIRRSLRQWLRWAATGVVVWLVAVQQLLLPVGDLVTGANWAIWALGWTTAALVHRFRLSRSMTALGCQWGVGAVVLLLESPTRYTVTTFGYNVASVAVIQGLALVFTVLLASAVRTANAVNQQHVRRTGAEASERAVMEDVQARYRALSLTLIPLLQRLSDPDLDPSDAHIRAEALIEGARLRRLFTQSDRHDHAVLQELQPLLAQAEERGVSVHVDAATTLPDMSNAFRDQLLLAPSMLLSGTASRARIVLTATDETVTVSVVCDCDEPTRTAAENALGVVPAVVGDLTWIELDHPLPSTSGASR